MEVIVCDGCEHSLPPRLVFAPYPANLCFDCFWGEVDQEKDEAAQRAQEVEDLRREIKDLKGQLSEAEMVVDEADDAVGEARRAKENREAAIDHARDMAYGAERNRDEIETELDQRKEELLALLAAQRECPHQKAVKNAPAKPTVEMQSDLRYNASV